MKATILAAALAFASLTTAATPAQWRSRSIYQVLTDRFARTDGSTTARCNTGDALYCGGTYQGLIKKLDYIQNMGFTAIWISPITFNLEERTAYGQAYHSYWQQNLYALNEHFGNANDLKALADALHRRGMYLMVDVVVNHMGWPGSFSSVDYSKFNPFNQQRYFHPYCTPDYNNQSSVEGCWLGDNNVQLVDLKTEDPTVANMLNAWIRQLVSNYTIDGLRIDTAKHVSKSFFPAFNAAAGIFITGEVFDGNPAYTCDYQNYMDSVLNFPIYFPLTRAFSSPTGSISELVNMVNQLKNGACKDTSLLGTFSENHDITRFAAITSDMSQARNVLAFTILADGVPIVYQGQEQHFSGARDPLNREAVWLSGYNTNAELYKLTAALNQIRNLAVFRDAGYVTYKNWVIYSDANTIAMRKGFDGGQIVTVLSNKGTAGNTYTLQLGNHGFANGAQVVDVLACRTVTVANGNIPVLMERGLPRAFYLRSGLLGSGICGL
ncbi:hypothetical protein W97_02565 [Coniosporium apollinis CBS 100218]|uniref:Alpha-amylase n=1 Tax=Coniosporium apollinis (strain CBS 100218) TaxID=1168221 RepID=R7YN93_CONA1|nr:uncharacterized protein W97_02565 [Coniosporium apollinis CBS 100218]EON63338.1 hypothetical protein W97_02565 [Coniosporium apollinis CBS 100218]